MEFVQSTPFRDLYPKLEQEDIKYFIYHTLKGLDYAHSCGIVHRDIKPPNVMMDIQEKMNGERHRMLKIVDWGLADFYEPAKRFNCRVATRYYKGPELLLENNYYDYSLDVWATGCMLAGMIFAKEPFFQGTSNDDQLIKIAKVIGSEHVLQYVEKFPHIELSQYFQDNLLNFKPKPWEKYVNSSNKDLVSDEAFDLLS